MSGDELRHLARPAFGERWQGPLGRHIGKDRSTVNKWANGQLRVGAAEALAVRTACAEALHRRRGTPPAVAALAGRRVLLAEDELAVAFDLAATLAGLGCAVVGPAVGLDRAMRLAEAAPLDGALLDITLGRDAAGRNVLAFPAAVLLRRRGVPVVLMSAYADLGRSVPAALRTLPCLPKPIDTAVLAGALAAACGLAPG